MNLELLSQSVGPAGTIGIRCSSIPQARWAFCTINVAEVAEDNTDWVFSTGGRITWITPQVFETEITLPEGFRGIFLITHVTVQEEPIPSATPAALPTFLNQPVTYTIHDPVVFEICADHDQARNSDEIAAEYWSILEARERDFLAGFGRVDDPQSREFRVDVLGRECLISHAMRLGQCKIMPEGGMLPEAEDRLSAKVIESFGFLPPPIPPERESEFRIPVVRFVFPRVLALNENDAIEITETAAQEIMDILALHRSASPTVIASIVQPFDTATITRSLPRYVYQGNVLSGPGTGEDPISIMRNWQRLRVNPVLRMQAALYREALRERNHRMAYFRYWSYLETVAWARGLNTELRADWTGTVVTPPKPIGSSSKGLVLELLRRVIGPGTGDIFSSKTDTEVDEEISIWYRRRNCLGHGGYCRCYPSSGTRERPQIDYDRCWAAKQRSDSIEFDLNLSRLRMVSESVMWYQFNNP